jgi:hypothetical protein
MLVLAVALLFAGCGLVSRAPQSPFGAFDSPPSSAQDLAAKLETRLGHYDNLVARTDTLASSLHGLGKRKNTILMRYKAPDRVRLGLAAEPFGILLRVVQNGKDIGLLDQRDPQNQVFYAGTLADLDAHPDFLFGLRPLGVVRPLLTSYELVEVLKKCTWGLSEPSFWHRTCTLEKTNPNGIRTVYTVGLADGLIRRMDIFGPDGERQVRLLYKAYGNFGGALFPSEFELRFGGSSLRLRAQVESVSLNQTPSDEMFSVEPPGNTEVRPLRELLEKKQ